MSLEIYSHFPLSLALSLFALNKTGIGKRDDFPLFITIIFFFFPIFSHMFSIFKCMCINKHLHSHSYTVTCIHMLYTYLLLFYCFSFFFASSFFWYVYKCMMVLMPLLCSKKKNKNNKWMHHTTLYSLALTRVFRWTILNTNRKIYTIILFI